jgi:hypothetical protein
MLPPITIARPRRAAAGVAEIGTDCVEFVMELIIHPGFTYNKSIQKFRLTSPAIK